MRPDLRKPAKGSGLMERRDRRRAIVAAEKAAKAKVKARDVRCRWPDCPECRAYGTRLECAHLVDKSLGGEDTTANMVLLCFLVHQGPNSLHQKTRRIEALTDKGADGPLRFWEVREQGWTVVHTEDVR